MQGAVAEAIRGKALPLSLQVGCCTKVIAFYCLFLTISSGGHSRQGAAAVAAGGLQHSTLLPCLCAGSTALLVSAGTNGAAGTVTGIPGNCWSASAAQRSTAQQRAEHAPIVAQPAGRHAHPPLRSYMSSCSLAGVWLPRGAEGTGGGSRWAGNSAKARTSARKGRHGAACVAGTALLYAGWVLQQHVTIPQPPSHHPPQLPCSAGAAARRAGVHLCRADGEHAALRARPERQPRGAGAGQLLDK